MLQLDFVSSSLHWSLQGKWLLQLDCASGKFIGHTNRKCFTTFSYHPHDVQKATSVVINPTHIHTYMDRKVCRFL